MNKVKYGGKATYYVVIGLALAIKHAGKKNYNCHSKCDVLQVM